MTKAQSPENRIHQFLSAEPADVYHAKASEFLSSHQLADFRNCPLLYWQKREGLIQEPDRGAYVVGRATHTLILEGKEQFDREYIFGGPINPRTNKSFGPGTQKYAEWEAKHGKTGISDANYDLILAMEKSVTEHHFARELLAEGVAEGVCRIEYCGMPSQIRLDWFNPDKGIVDFKTCENLDFFTHDARKFQYIHQMTFYRSVLATKIDIDPSLIPVHLIACEKKSPFRAGVWKVDSQALEMARIQNQAAIDRLKRCLRLGQWPTLYEEPRVIDCV